MAGLCTPLTRTRIERLFPVAIDRLVDMDAGKRQGRVNDRVDWHLRRFLELAGFFEVLPGKRNPPEAVLESLRVTTIDFERWHRAGAWLVIKGSIQKGKKRGHLILTLRAFLVESGEAYPLKHDVQALPNAKARTIRWAVSRWVDDFMVAFTGKGGTFSTRIAFAKRMKKGGAKEIFVMDMDGSGERAITRNGTINMLPTWTPRKKVAYTSFVKHNPDLYISGRIFSNRPQMNTGASWHPNGTLCALTLSKDGNAEIYVLNPNNGEVISRLTNHWGIDTSPAWSPDGSQIAFVSDRHGSPQIWIMGADGGGARRVTFQGDYNQTPAWSPKGDKIAFTARDERNVFDIFTVEVGSGKIERLTQNQGNNEEPTWSPDGNYLAFTSTRDGGSHIYLSTGDGRYQTKITQGKGGFLTPAWGK